MEGIRVVPVVEITSAKHHVFLICNMNAEKNQDLNVTYVVSGLIEKTA